MDNYTALVTYNDSSRGYVVEYIQEGNERCYNWMLFIPGENLWHEGVRGFLYILLTLYIFFGIAIASDLFMCAIEVITSTKRKVVKWDEEKQERVEKEVLIWNETVANLTLMALGSSAPEIILSVISTCQTLDIPNDSDGLGTFTIIGSASFNLLVITSICIMSVPSPTPKKIRELGVFVITSIFSIFAYVWMLFVLVLISPGEIEVWEAWLTLLYFPIMVVLAYCQDSGWWCKKKTSQVDTVGSQVNVRVITNDRRGSVMHGLSKELTVLEKEKMNRSMANLHESKTNISTEDEELGSQTKLVKSGNHLAPSTTSTRARFRFRHAAVRSMLGGKKPKVLTENQLKARLHDAEHNFKTPGAISEADLLGKFTFAAPSYSVLESAGILEIDILFHRKIPPKSTSLKMVNGTANGTKQSQTETSFNEHKGVVSVQYETREGSGKFDKDFKFASGTLVFKETEIRKTITIPIINDNQYESDKDFYVFLRNNTGDSGIGDPSVSRVTIIDDDEPGEFQFEEPHCYANPRTGVVSATVIRQKGCDGTVTLEYSTIDGTAKGGDKLGDGTDYKRTDGILNFKHGETSKQIVIDVNKETQGSKNFIVTLRNPSLGAKIGEHSAVVANITTDDMAQRIADILGDDDEEDVTWAGQFRNAMTLEPSQDDDGNEVPLKWYDFLLHFVTFFWKVLHACLPPKHIWGAWPLFLASLVSIGVQAAVIDALGSLLGCVIGLRTSVAGISIIAMGTSVPDTFASRTAAIQDDNADAAIGNITGSNSVNVFLGLGLPWVIKTMYLTYGKKVKYTIATNNLVQSVIIFSVFGTFCIIMLLVRRKVVGGELGGTKTNKYLSSIFLICLWVTWLIIVSINAYYPEVFPWN